MVAPSSSSLPSQTTTSASNRGLVVHRQTVASISQRDLGVEEMENHRADDNNNNDNDQEQSSIVSQEQQLEEPQENDGEQSSSTASAPKQLKIFNNNPQSLLLQNKFPSESWVLSNARDENQILLNESTKGNNSNNKNDNGDDHDDYNYDYGSNNCITVFQADPLVYVTRREQQPSNQETVLQPKNVVVSFPRIDFTMERQMLTDALLRPEDVLVHDIQLHYDVATVDRLETFFTKGQGRLLHFSCHGHPQYLSIEDGWGVLHPLLVQRLQAWIRGSSATTPSSALLSSQQEQQQQISLQKPPKSKVQFVFVSACYSRAAGQAFLDAGIPHVVCCRHAFGQEGLLENTTAMEFAKAFYHALACGKTIRHAFERGQQHVLNSPTASALQTEDGESVFTLLPVEGQDGIDSNYHHVSLFSSSSFNQERRNGRHDESFEQPSIPSQKQVPPMSLLPVPPVIFEGRQIEMHQVLDAFRSGRRVIGIGGPSGIGKGTLVMALAQYILQRQQVVLNATPTEEPYPLVWLSPQHCKGQPPESTSNSSSHDQLLAQLSQFWWQDDKQEQGGKSSNGKKVNGNRVNDATYEQLIHEIVQSLHHRKILIIIDVRSLHPSFSKKSQLLDRFLNDLLQWTAHVKVILIYPSTVGPSASGQEHHDQLRNVQIHLYLSPLDYRSSVSLFARLCSHVGNHREVMDLLAPPHDEEDLDNRGNDDSNMTNDDSLSTAAFLTRQEYDIYQNLGQGNPGQIVRFAATISDDKYRRMLDTAAEAAGNGNQERRYLPHQSMESSASKTEKMSLCCAKRRYLLLAAILLATIVGIILIVVVVVVIKPTRATNPLFPTLPPAMTAMPTTSIPPLGDDDICQVKVKRNCTSVFYGSQISCQDIYPLLDQFRLDYITCRGSRLERLTLRYTGALCRSSAILLPPHPDAFGCLDFGLQWQLLEDEENDDAFQVKQEEEWMRNDTTKRVYLVARDAIQFRNIFFQGWIERGEEAILMRQPRRREQRLQGKPKKQRDIRGFLNVTTYSSDQISFNTTLQTIFFYLGCDGSLHPNDQFGSVMLTNFESDTSNISLSTNISLQYTIENIGETALRLQTLDIDRRRFGVDDLTPAIGGAVLNAGDSLNVEELLYPADTYRRQWYSFTSNVTAQTVAIDSRQVVVHEGQSCDSFDILNFEFGNPLPFSTPTSSPTPLPTLSPMPSSEPGPCSDGTIEFCGENDPCSEETLCTPGSFLLEIQFQTTQELCATSIAASENLNPLICRDLMREEGARPNFVRIVDAEEGDVLFDQLSVPLGTAINISAWEIGTRIPKTLDVSIGLGLRRIFQESKILTGCNDLDLGQDLGRLRVTGLAVCKPSPSVLEDFVSPETGTSFAPPSTMVDLPVTAVNPFTPPFIPIPTRPPSSIFRETAGPVAAVATLSPTSQTILRNPTVPPITSVPSSFRLPEILAPAPVQTSPPFTFVTLIPPPQTSSPANIPSVAAGTGTGTPGIFSPPLQVPAPRPGVVPAPVPLPFTGPLPRPQPELVADPSPVCPSDSSDFFQDLEGDSILPCEQNFDCEGFIEGNDEDAKRTCCLYPQCICGSEGSLLGGATCLPDV